MLRQKITAMLLACIMLLAALCGCGEEEPLTITLRTMSTLGDGAEYDVYSSLIADFSAEYPNIYIRDTSTSAADSFRLGASKEETYTASSAPHVVYYTAEGGISALSEYFVSVEEIREIYPDFAQGVSESALDCFRLADGKVYCVPVMGEWTAIVVNKAVLQQYSVAVPTDWNSLLEAVLSLSEQGVLPFANSADDTAAVLEALITAYGSSESVRLGLEGYSNMIDPCWKLALADLSQLFRCDAFAPASLTAETEQLLLDSAPETVSYSDVSSSDIAAVSSSDLFCGHPLSSFPEFYDDILGSDRDRSTRTDAARLFNDGLAAMIVIDSAELSDINYTDGCTVIPFPSPLGGTGEVIMGGFRSGFAITRRAFSDPDVRDAAVAFVDCMTGQDAAGRFAALGYLPANTGRNVSFPGAVGSLLAASRSDSYCLSTRTGSAVVKWNSISRLCAQLYYQLLTPEDICSQLSDPELIWTEQPAEDAADTYEAVSSTDTPSE